MITTLIIAAAIAADTNRPYFYAVGDNPLTEQGPPTNTVYQSFTSIPVRNPAPPKPKGPPQIITAELRKSLSRITSRGFITSVKSLPDDRKELTWTDGKNTVVTTQKVERVNSGKARDPRRAELEAVKAERDALRAEKDKQPKTK